METGTVSGNARTAAELRIPFAQILVCWSSPTTKCVRRWGGKDVPL
jgi:hypothetical protein